MVPRHERGGSMTERGSVTEVFRVFLRLGLTSFGGPVAHLGYFRTEFVARRRWLTEADYAEIVALCQFLPGPASSQTGFALGLLRAGPWGAAAAFAGFTLPSALALCILALLAADLDGPLAQGVVAGLKIVAVAIVAQAVIGMARGLCPDLPRRVLALMAAALVLFWPGAGGMLAAIGLGALAGRAIGAEAAAGGTAGGWERVPVSRSAGLACLALCAALLLGLPALAALTDGGGTLALLDAVFRAGARVFGGGQVVLPLLEAEVVAPGWVAPDAFLAGYGAAQAVPGPLFTFAAWLGALSSAGPGGVAGAALALAAIFLPGFLLLLGVLPFWAALRGARGARAAVAGANAAVVGVLAAALVTPVAASALTGWAEAALALAAFGLLTGLRAPPLVVVLLTAAGGAALALA